MKEQQKMQQEKDEKEALIQKKFSQMSESEQKRLQHEAMVQAQKQLEKGENPKSLKQEKSDELEDWDELTDVTDDWDNVSAYSKFMSHSEAQ